MTQLDANDFLYRECLASANRPSAHARAAMKSYGPVHLGMVRLLSALRRGGRRA